MKRHGHYGVESGAVYDLQHQRRGESVDDPLVAAVFEGVDYLLADAVVLQRGPRARVGNASIVRGLSVLGAGCVVGEGNVLDQGIRVNPGVVVSPRSLRF